MKNAIYSLLFLSLSFINFYSSCDKPKDEYIEVIFEVPLSITPIKDSINLGDTLTLEANFSDSVREVKTGKRFKLQNFDFKTRISFFRLTSNTIYLSQQPGSLSSYNIYPITGSISNTGESFANLNFQQMNSDYFAKIKLVPKTKGVFNIGFYSQHVHSNIPLTSINVGNTSSGGKKIAALKNIWYTVNNGNTNVELLKQHSKLVSASTNPTEDNIQSEQRGTYTFVVK